MTERFAKMRNGIGSYMLKDGTKRYRVSYRIGGRQHTKGGFRTKGEAAQWKSLRDAEAVRGHTPDPALSRQLFGPWAEDWLEAHCEDIRPSTAALYRQHYRSHIAPTFGGLPFQHITRDVVNRWHRDMKRKPARSKTGKLSKATVAKVYRLLRQLYAAAVKDGCLPQNPCDIEGAAKEDLPEGSYDEPPTVAQVRALADAVPARYRAMVLLAGFGGLRWGEVAGLEAQHVNVADGCVKVRQQITQVDGGPPTVVAYTKTKAGRRTVYLHPEVVEALKVHLATYATTGFLFSSPKGEPLRATNFRRRVWVKATKEAGCPGVKFHDLRHTAATLAAQTGATTKELMDRMGHASVAAAMRYQHATDDRQKAIAARMAVNLAPADNVVELKRAQ